MKNNSQKAIVLKQMRQTGSVSRNWCLSNYISRLSAIMLDLKKDGINFETKKVGGDYVYTLKDKPKNTIVYKVDGLEVARKVLW